VTSPKPSDEEELEASRAPLLDHLMELRSRLIVALLALIAGTAVAYMVAGGIFELLVAPYREALVARHLLAPGEAPHLQITAPLEGFYTYLRIAIFGGIILSFPVLAYQAYAFVAPGLYRRERMAAVPFLVAAPIMFGVGAVFAYYVALPFAMMFALGFQAKSEHMQLDLVPKMNEYFSLASTLILAFGLCFQMPVVLSLLARVGLVSAGVLRKGRRFAVVGIAAFAAMVTPPDVISMTMMALPMYGLYEISIWLVALIGRARTADEARETAASAAE